MQVRLYVRHEKASVKRVLLTGDTVIGRSSECDLRIASNLVSRKHCEFTITENAVLLQDLGSANGTLVNGQPIPSHQTVAIQPGHEVVVGPVKFEVQFELPTFGTPPGSTAELRPHQSEEMPDWAASGQQEALEETVQMDSPGGAGAHEPFDTPGSVEDTISERTAENKEGESESPLLNSALPTDSPFPSDADTVYGHLPPSDDRSVGDAIQPSSASPKMSRWQALWNLFRRKSSAGAVGEDSAPELIEEPVTPNGSQQAEDSFEIVIETDEGKAEIEDVATETADDREDIDSQDDSTTDAPLPEQSNPEDQAMADFLRQLEQDG